jgi:hypothetical protein
VGRLEDHAHPADTQLALDTILACQDTTWLETLRGKSYLRHVLRTEVRGP